jgi:hypothetical protein
MKSAIEPRSVSSASAVLAFRNRRVVPSRRSSTSSKSGFSSRNDVGRTRTVATRWSGTVDFRCSQAPRRSAGSLDGSVHRAPHALAVQLLVVVAEHVQVERGAHARQEYFKIPCTSPSPPAGRAPGMRTNGSNERRPEPTGSPWVGRPRAGVRSACCAPKVQAASKPRKPSRPCGIASVGGDAHGRPTLQAVERTPERALVHEMGQRVEAELRIFPCQLG